MNSMLTYWEYNMPTGASKLRLGTELTYDEVVPVFRQLQLLGCQPVRLTISVCVRRPHTSPAAAVGWPSPGTVISWEEYYEQASYLGFLLACTTHLDKLL